MPVIESSREIDASPETIWRILASHREWPHWSPLFQHVGSESPELGMAGEWTLHGIIGRVPYNGLFRTEVHRPVELLIIRSIRVSPPYEFVRHSVALKRDPVPKLAWRIEYGTSGGPGGWIIDRLLIRRQARALLERGLDALVAETGDSPANPTGRPGPAHRRSVPPH